MERFFYAAAGQPAQTKCFSIDTVGRLSNQKSDIFARETFFLTEQGKSGQARAALQQERVICGAIDNLMLRPAVDLSGTQRAPHIHHGAIQRDLEENKALSCSLWL